MSKQEILDRVQDILNQDGNVQALDLLRHDLENDIIEDGHTSTNSNQTKIDFEVEKNTENDDFEIYPHRRK